MAFEDYFWEGQGCLRNLLGTHNPIELEDAAGRYAAAGIVKLCMDPVPEKIDGAFLKAIHKCLFEHVYDWAGEYRDCLMGRNMDYAAPEEIDGLVEAFCEKFGNLFLNAHFDTISDIGHALAYHWGDLNAIHPFRDGNGRSQFVFFDTACRMKGYDLVFDRQDVRGLRSARDSASEGRVGLLGGMITRALAPREAV